MSDMYAFLLKEYEMEQKKVAIKQTINDLFKIYKRVRSKQGRKTRVRFAGKKSVIASLIKANCPVKTTRSLIKECLIELGANTRNSNGNLIYINVVPKTLINKNASKIEDTSNLIDETVGDKKPQIYKKRGLIKRKSIKDKIPEVPFDAGETKEQIT
jgi:hypothetical protein